jgi:hypothetical protein
MPEIRLTYWWRDHEPGDVVTVDDETARLLLASIAVPATGAPDAAAPDTAAPARAVKAQGRPSAEKPHE